MSGYYFKHLKPHEVQSLRNALVSDVRFYHSGKMKSWKRSYLRDQEIAINCWLEALGGLGAVW